MIIPDSVNILFKNYAVSYENTMRDEKGNTLYGQIDYIEQKITLNRAAKASLSTYARRSAWISSTEAAASSLEAGITSP